ncbi:MAG: hypothetical protein ACR2P1_07705 [Pseudomonadales bacterium]
MAHARKTVAALFIVCGFGAVVLQTPAYANDSPSLSDLQSAGKLQIKTWIEPGQGIIVNQQINLAIEIATDQWFSGGTRIGRLEIDDAVVLRREQFAVNSTRREGGDTWSVQLWSISIYPQRDGVFEIPALRLTLSVAGEDGKPVTGELYTEPVSFQATVPDAVAALSPADEPSTPWVASPAFSVEESYSQSHDRGLQNLQAGDAVQRRVEFKAENVAAMMLPAFAGNEQEGLAIYQKPPRLHDDINRGIYQAQRAETITYVIESPGDYVLPELTYYWWDLSSQTLKTVTLSEQRISTADASPAGAAPQDRQRTVRELALLVVKIGVPLLLLSIPFFLWRRHSRNVKQTTVVPGEHALRKKLLQACQRGDTPRVVTLLYQWLDHYQNKRFDGSIRNLLQDMNQQELQSMFEPLMQRVYANANGQAEVEIERFVSALVDELRRNNRTTRWSVKPVLLELN